MNKIDIVTAIICVLLIHITAALTLSPDSFLHKVANAAQIGVVLYWLAGVLGVGGLT